MIKHEKLKNFLSTVPALLGWAALMLVIWGFVFLRLDDVSPERKLIIYTDCDIVNARELMINLEDECGISSDREYVFGENDIRKIKLYTTSFFSALSDPLGDGDLFIISETVLKDLEDEFVSLPEELLTSSERFGNKGILFFDPVSDDLRGTEYFLYDASERYYLCFNAKSQHAGSRDSAAFRLAEVLLNMNWNEENGQ